MSKSAGGSFLSHAFTDLMASLAVIFILLTVVFIRSAAQSSKREKQDIQNGLAAVLEKNSLPIHQDPADPLTLFLRVGEDVLKFDVNSDKLSSAGVNFIDAFAPDLAQELCSESIRSKVDTVIIEGHTDKSGEASADGTGHNIQLSQNRSFAVLSRILQAIRSKPDLYNCIAKIALASGRGSSSPVLLGGLYDANLSRRVEIKIRVKSTEQKVFNRFKTTPETPVSTREGNG